MTAPRTRTAGSDWSSWSTTSQDGDSATGSVDVEPGHGICFSLCAVDRAGNTSDMSAPECTVVDGVAPSVGRVTGPGRFAPPNQNGRISFGYGATDDFGVASYDVQTRLAKPGQPLGAWVHPRCSTVTSVP